MMMKVWKINSPTNYKDQSVISTTTKLCCHGIHKSTTQLFIFGVLSLFQAAYSAAQHRSYLRITEQTFDALPFDIFLQGVVSLCVLMYSILYLAGDFKEIRAMEEQGCKTSETLNNTPSLYIFNHRGKALFSNKSY